MRREVFGVDELSLGSLDGDLVANREVLEVLGDVALFVGLKERKGWWLS